jgi:hypothetical protein
MRNHFLLVFSLLVFSLAVPLSVLCQSYADSPFYKKVPAVPSTARVEGWSHGSIKANGIVIDLSISEPSSSSDREAISGPGLTNSWVDRNKHPPVFHYFTQNVRLNAVFGYDLLVEPVPGTDQIRCTFSALTDPAELPETSWRRDQNIPVVPLPGSLAPIILQSGQAIAITILPLAEPSIAVTHYLRLTRTDLTPDPAQPQDPDTSADSAEPRTDLLQKIEQRFKNAGTFDVKGTASADIPGS